MDSGIGNEDYYKSSYGERGWRFYSPIVGEIVSYSCPGPILDVGAGIGLLTECATRWGLECDGIDGSPDALAIALERSQHLRLHRHLLSEPLPFPASSFQTVVLNQVIEHLEPSVARRTVLECYRVLRPCGMILVHSPSRFNKFQAEDDPTHINMYTPKELRTLVTQCGFHDYVAVDIPLEFLGSHRIGKALASLLFRALRWDRLSATANCRAFKSL
jgi:SAM-dependent methyltransferase